MGHRARQVDPRLVQFGDPVSDHDPGHGTGPTLGPKPGSEHTKETLAPKSGSGGDEPRSASVAVDRRYLLVFAGASSSLHNLPVAGEVTIGRGPESTLRLDDGSVSRRQAKLVLSTDEARLVDLGSRNGTLVNGERLVGERLLAAGDLITFGAVTLVFHRYARAPHRRRVLEAGALRSRLEEEIERAMRYGRALTLLSLYLPGGDPVGAGPRVLASLRLLDIVGSDGPERFTILLPESDPETVGALIARLRAELAPIAPTARIGVGSCPGDGCDAETLLDACRAAAAHAGPGELATPWDAARHVRVGELTLVVADPKMQRVYALLERLAHSELPVLVCGETGSGKEIASQALHHWSPRRAARLVTINCAALQDTLIESELFGYEKGAFTGASAAKKGLLEVARGGTVFLDEVGELSASAQAKLLRAIEARRVAPVGSVAERDIDIRLVAATNRNLEDEVRNGRFREDLYFRLSAATVILPPLRDRRRELPLLLRSFVADACARADRPTLEISRGALSALGDYAWPGNVRELRNVAEYLASTVVEPVVERSHLPERLRGEPAVPEALLTTDAAPALSAEVPPRDIYDEIRELERARMAAALAATGGNQTKAAERIGMPLRTFVTKMKQYGLTGAARTAG